MSSKKLNKGDLRKMFFRCLALNAANDYPAQMAKGYTFCMQPALDKIYDSEEKRKRALMRHMEYFNITPALAGVTLGISAAMEEENAENSNFDESSINTTKTALMGPLSAIGDTLFLATLRILATSIVITMAAAGNLMAPVLFLLIYDIPQLLVRWYSLKFGYSLGTSFLISAQSSRMMEKATWACNVVGLMAIGAMAAASVKLSTPITIGDIENGGMVLQNTLDSVLPKMLPLGLVWLDYWLLNKKGIKVVPMLIGTMIVGVILFMLGIIG